MVSVICTAYNHERYIRKTLDGFVSQKTKFKYEVLIHDDASTDKTADIIREYEKKYPELIKPIYQTENQYSKKQGIVGKLTAKLVNGKYVALCEGDDYWSEPLKLQKQIDALENNQSCYFCVCGTDIINEDGSPTGKSYPKTPVKGGVISSRDFIELTKAAYNFQTSSYFVLASLYKQFYLTPPKFKAVADVGDEPLMLYFAHMGNVYYIDEKMSCYRLNSISSWNRNVRSKIENAIKHTQKMVEMFQEFDEYSNYKYHDVMEERIAITKYNLEVRKKNYKEIYAKKNKKYYKRLSFKGRLLLRIEKVVPSLYPVIHKCYRKIKGK